jgi:hypothetical protein
MLKGDDKGTQTGEMKEDAALRGKASQNKETAM